MGEKEDIEKLRIQRLIPAPPDRVFRAWTNPDELVEWWGPAGVRCRSAEIDLTVGGTYRIANEMPDGSLLWISGEFETIERPHLLIYTWVVETDTRSTERVSVRFEEHESGTTLSLQHELIPTQELLEQHTAGWEGCLVGLNAHLGTT